MNGLSITRDEFASLPRIEKDKVIYDNLEYIRKRVSDWKFHMKLNYMWLSLITLVGTWILQRMLK